MKLYIALRGSTAKISPFLSVAREIKIEGVEAGSDTVSVFEMTSMYRAAVERTLASSMVMRHLAAEEFSDILGILYKVRKTYL